MAIVERIEPAGEVSFNIACVGSGQPPIVLLHGVLRAWQDFSPLVPALSVSRRLLAIDFPGHGRSSPAGSYYVVDYVRHTVELLNRQLDEPAVLLGHSLGAMVALAVAAELPKRVDAVMLEDPPFETMGSRIAASGLLPYFEQLERLAVQQMPASELARQMAEIRMPTADWPDRRLCDVRDPASLRFAAHLLSRTDPRVLRPIVQGEWLRGYDMTSLVDRVTCPALLLQGDAALGGMLTIDDARSLCTALVDCTLVPMSHVGHHIHWMQTESMLRAVHAFLASVESPS